MVAKPRHLPGPVRALLVVFIAIATGALAGVAVAITVGGPLAPVAFSTAALAAILQLAAPYAFSRLKPVAPVGVTLVVTDTLVMTDPGLTRLSSCSLLRYCFDRLFPRLNLKLTRRGPLSQPPEWPVLNKYLRQLRAEIRQEFREKTYLPLAGRPIPGIGPIDQQLCRDGFVSPVHQGILQILGESYGGDSASAQIAAASRRSRLVRNIIKKLDSSKFPLILLGEPGSGKTMTLQQSAMLLAEREIDHVFPLIPVYVRLGEFYVAGDVSHKDVWSYVKASADESILPLMDELCWSGRLVLFFDGMDEMSRHRYSEHTEALSVFAAAVPSKTLFSCRITDFSPSFQHQRLVILPFDRRQVEEYLRLYVPRFPILISGQEWSLKKLAKYLAQGEPAVEANNPFVLWLLCLYVQGEHSWPASRVEMLEYYNKRNYERKTEEAERQGHPFRIGEEVFDSWARLAYQITERNRGPAILPSQLEGFAPTEPLEMIRVGRLCGVLTDSGDGQAESIRFHHHRFQEYFTARHIQRTRPRITWLSKFDAPRWQETMLNLVLMGKGDRVAEAFADSISRLTEDCRADIATRRVERAEFRLEQGLRKLRSGEPADEVLDERLEGLRKEVTDLSPERVEAAIDRFRRDYESGINESADASGEHEELKEPELALNDAHETILADRVEVASRILRQIRVGEVGVRGKLMQPFIDAVSLLAEYGNPITQVKMMRSCQNVPEVDFIEALRRPLNSSVDWVRNQALLLLGSSQASARAIGSDIATEIGYDLATGHLPARLPAYLRAIHSTDNRYGWSLVAGLTCCLLNVLFLVSIVAAIYVGAFSLRTTYLEPSKAQEPIHVRLSDWTYFNPQQWGFNEISLNVQGSLTVQGSPSNSMPLDLQGYSALDEPVYLALFVLAVLLSVVWAIGRSPSMLWGVTLGSAATTALLLPMGAMLWNGNVLGPFTVVFVALVGCSIFVPVLALLAAIAQLGTLGVYLLLSGGARGPGHSPRTFLLAAWQGAHYGGCIKEPLEIGAIALGGTVLCMVVLAAFAVVAALAALVLLALCQIASDLSHLPFHPLANAAIVLLLLPTAIWRIRSRADPMRTVLKSIPSRPLIAYLAGLCVILLVNAVAALLDVQGRLERLWSEFGIPILRLVTVLVVGIFSVLLLRFQLTTWSSYLLHLRGSSLRPFPPGHYSIQRWQEEIRGADPWAQEMLLARSEPLSLGLTAETFGDVLKSVEGSIKAEPASSAYWEKRDRLGEALKQERHG